MTPTLSIITVSAFEAERLKVTLQSYSNLPPSCEIILVSPVKDHRARELFDELRPLFGCDSLLIEDEGEGIYEAMNVGIAAASGDYVVFWNAGDFIHSVEALDNLVSRLRRIECRWLLFPAIFDWRDSSPLRESTPVDFLSLRDDSYISHQQIVFSRHTLIELGGFSIRFRVASDLHLISRFSRYKPFLENGSPIVNIEFPDFSSKNNRKGRMESGVILFFHHIGLKKFVILFRILFRDLRDMIRFRRFQ